MGFLLKYGTEIPSMYNTTTYILLQICNSVKSILTFKTEENCSKTHNKEPKSAHFGTFHKVFSAKLCNSHTFSVKTH